MYEQKIVAKVFETCYSNALGHFLGLFIDDFQYSFPFLTNNKD